MIKRRESKTNSSRRKHRSAEARRKQNSAEARRRRLQMEDLEQRQLLAVLTEPPTSPPPTNLPLYTQHRNVGAVQAFTFIESERLNETGLNDTTFEADFVPLGTGPGQQDTIDLVGTLPPNLGQSATGFVVDTDTFAFDLRAGDILDVATLGAAGDFAVRDANRQIIFGSQVPADDERPYIVQDAPKQNIGNALGSVVIPTDGRYTVTIAAADFSSNYTVGLRVYRPVTESLPVGDTQILYLDFDGDIIDANAAGFDITGFVRIPSLLESLPVLGLEIGDVDAANELIDGIVDNTIRIFEDITRTGTNGDFVESGTPGDYAIRILNSRDHAGQVSLSDPRLTRMLIGGTGDDLDADGVFGFSFLDIGNFNLSQFGFFALDAFADAAQNVALAPGASQLDYLGDFIAAVVAHEAGHSFGMAHTENTNTIGTISDAGGTAQSQNYGEGLGPDLIYGTLDDVPPIFQNDFYIRPSADENPFFGLNLFPAALSHVLSTGVVGTNSSGRAFNDLNNDGVGVGEPGLAGVSVFADANGNGVFDVGEISDVTGADGTFNLDVADSGVNVIASTPAGFVATTPLVQSGGGIAFGFHETNPLANGIVFSDNDGDGFLDPSEDGLEGFFVYLDLNGNDVIDLGEPKAITGEDGTYVIDFPGPGPYTVRVVSEPGFELTTPVSGEYTNGVPEGTEYDFGFLPSFDFGDAPISYGTLDSDLGAKHGITAGLSIGALVDRELNGQPTADASGDDATDLDDEDGVRLLSPLGPGSPATFLVNVTNTSGVGAFLQGFMDFNIDGDFNDPGEQFATNIAIPTGSVGVPVEVTVNVPADAAVGDTFARFRLSQTPGIGATGFAQTGEVEDYTFPILTDARLANDDTAIVPRNSQQQIDVLANDFQTPENPLTISNLILNGTEPETGRPFTTEGTVRIAGDSRSVFYTPPNGFIGRDFFGYTVMDRFGNTGTAYVTVNVSFQTEVPIALDDIFSVPEGSSDRALNVLDNDVSSIFGGVTITSVTRGDNGGSVRIVGGGQSLRYTPAPGFSGTEQFTYSIQDANGQADSAKVTVNLLPGSLFDDRVEYTIGIFDPINPQRELTNVQVGDEFLARVSVEDIDASRGFVAPKGVASAFLDVLYTDELATIISTVNGPDITFGPLFGGLGSAQNGDVDTPGLIDEIGGVQPVTNITDHFSATELFTVRMRAVSPGVAVFQTDPADLDESPQSETILIDEDVALEVREQRFGQVELQIFPESDNFASAIDDSYPDSRDSDGRLITDSTEPHRLDVLENDNLGDSGIIREFNLVTGSTLGTVQIDRNGTPTNFNDDFIVYQPFVNSNGLERFTYLIVTDDNVRSTAEVTISLGNQATEADVFYDMSLVSGTGSGAALDPTTIGIGDRIGIQVNAEDTRFTPSFVFAGFLDLLYSSDILTPSDTDPSDGFDFDVQFGEDYVQDPDIDATAFRPGIIDEVGTFSTATSDDGTINGGELFTVFFDVVGNGTARLVGSPADAMPFSDTLLFNVDDPIPTSNIRYDVLEFTVGPQQNGRLRQDVNNDNFVTPVDALLIINQLSRSNGAEGEQTGGATGSGSRYFTDVNGDNLVTAIDALQVINYLVRGGNGASGEQIVGAVGSGSSSNNDDVITDLSGDSKIIDSGSAGLSAGPGVAVLGSDIDASDDDDEDLIGLLADDIANQWS